MCPWNYCKLALSAPASATFQLHLGSFKKAWAQLLDWDLDIHLEFDGCSWAGKVREMGERSWSMISFHDGRMVDLSCIDLSCSRGDFRKTLTKHLLMEEIRPTSWHGQFPIICRVSYMSRWCRISSIHSIIHCYPVSCHWNFAFLENHSCQQPNIHTPSKTKGRFRQGNRAWGSSQLWNRTIQTTGIYTFRIWYMKYDDICGMPCVLLRYEIKQD